jgi:hypothetical protein
MRWLVTHHLALLEVAAQHFGYALAGRSLAGTLAIGMLLLS